jgi:hypothetical protein
VNPLKGIWLLVDPVEWYHRRAEKELPPSVPLRDYKPPDPAGLPGDWVDASEPERARALAEATGKLLEHGAVRIRTADGVVAAKLVRFWTGSAILDIRSIGSTVSAGWGRRISRLRQRPRIGTPPPLNTLQHEVRSRLEDAVEEQESPRPPSAG